jgi:hypothetical protein
LHADESQKLFGKCLNHSRNYRINLRIPEDSGRFLKIVRCAKFLEFVKEFAGIIYCSEALYKRLHAHNCGFLSKFVTVDGKYRKCQKNIHFYLLNPIPENPGPISRERQNRREIVNGKSRE